jgi:ATP-dependent DNA ligase
MARRDPVGIRLITRRGNDWTARFPLIVEAVNHLKVRSCLIADQAVRRIGSSSRTRTRPQ